MIMEKLKSRAIRLDMNDTFTIPTVLKNSCDKGTLIILLPRTGSEQKFMNYKASTTWQGTLLGAKDIEVNKKKTY